MGNFLFFLVTQTVKEVEWKKGVQIALHAFFGGQYELKACSAGTESVSLQASALKPVRQTELNPGDAVLIRAIASHVAGDGFPFIISTSDHTIE